LYQSNTNACTSIGCPTGKVAAQRKFLRQIIWDAKVWSDCANLVTRITRSHFDRKPEIRCNARQNAVQRLSLFDPVANLLEEINAGNFIQRGAGEPRALPEDKSRG